MNDLGRSAPARPAAATRGAGQESPADRVRRTVRQIGWMRLAGSVAFLLLAIAFARFSWSIPLSGDAERLLYDVRAYVTSPHVDQDPRITMVVYTDETLAATGKRSPLDRATLARALTALDGMGAKAIGIDILIDQAQPEDDQLIAAFRRMKTPTYLAFASNATNANYMRTWQEAFVRAFIAKLPPGNVRATSIRIEPDPDGVMRNWPAQPRSLPPLMANSMVPGHDAFRDYQAGISWRLPLHADRPVFNSLPIDLFAVPGMADALKPQIAGRYVLIGGDISDIDQFEVPATRYDKDKKTTIGLEVHANLLAQLLDGKMFVRTPWPLVWLAAILVVLSAGVTALLDVRRWVFALLLVGQFLLIAFVPFALRWAGVDTQRIPAFGWIIGWVIAYSAVSSSARAVTSEQRRFAQSALGKYLPRDVANEIMRDPASVSLHGEKREIYALFTDLEGFTKLSHAIEPEMVAYLLNRYLDMLSETVLRHGGTIDKFVGDAIVAFWGAPIARPDDADRAARCAIAMYETGQRFRTEVPPPGVPPIGVTRVGLHKGEAIVGNFGGEGRIQYTALGDSMNLAARLEGANKQLKTCALVSGPARWSTDSVAFRPMGRVAVRGRSTPIDVYEPLVDPDTGHVTVLTALLARFDEGDGTALEELTELVRRRPDDAALANLVYRLGHVGPGGSFVLE